MQIIDRESISDEELFSLLNKVVSNDRSNNLLRFSILGKCAYILDDIDDFIDYLKPEYLIDWMGNIFYLVGAYLFSKFNQWRECSTDGIPNSLKIKGVLQGFGETDNLIKPSTTIRVLRVLDGLYENYEFNFSFLKYLITNSQIEAGQKTTKSKKRCGLSKVLGFPTDETFSLICHCGQFEDFEVEGKNLANAFYLVNLLRNDFNYLSSLQNNKYDIKEIRCALEDVLEAFTFLKRISLAIEEDGAVSFIEKKKTSQGHSETIVPSNGIVRLFSKDESGEFGLYNGEPYKSQFFFLYKMKYLSGIETGASDIDFVFHSFDDTINNTISFSKLKKDEKSSPTDEYKKISGHLPGTKTNSSFLRGMINASYRYHNILAPSIVDAIDDLPSARIRIIKRFVKNEEMMFRDFFEPTFNALEKAGEVLYNEDFKSKIDSLCAFIENRAFSKRRILDWDTLLTKILIYEGPTEVLRTVFLKDGDYSSEDVDRIREVGDAIIAGLEVRYIDKIFDAVDVSKRQKEYYRVAGKKNAAYKELYPNHVSKMDSQVLAQSYIDILVKYLARLDVDEKKPETNNKFSQNSLENSLELFLKLSRDTEEAVSKNDEKTFIRTIASFLCFYAGLKKTCEPRMEYEFSKSMKILSTSETLAAQKEINKVFLEGAKEKAEEISKGLKNNTIDNSLEFILKELYDFAFNKEDEKYFRFMLARAAIDKHQLKKIYIYNQETQKVYFVCKSEEPIDFEQAYQEGLIAGFLYKILTFLSGLNYKLTGLSDEYKEFSKGVIYPQVVTFAKRKEDGDSNNCLIMDHHGSFLALNESVVQILTEFEYKINYAYYVLPNLIRTEADWWIDPFMISCSEFDAIITKYLI